MNSHSIDSECRRSKGTSHNSALLTLSLFTFSLLNPFFDAVFCGRHSSFSRFLLFQPPKFISFISRSSYKFESFAYRLPRHLLRSHTQRTPSRRSHFGGDFAIEKSQIKFNQFISSVQFHRYRMHLECEFQRLRVTVLNRLGSRATMCQKLAEVHDVAKDVN
jgi:hypothetical protein